MKHPIARVVAVGALLSTTLAPPQLAQHVGVGAAPAYEIRYLLGLGGTNSRGNSINNDGLIAGYSHLNPSYRHAALWQSETPVDLGTLGSKNKSKNSNVAWPVKNTRGLIVGISQTDSPDPWGENWSCSAFFPPATATGSRCLGFAWENGKMRALPTLGGTHGYAAGANNLGQIVGWAENTVRDTETCTPPQIFQFRAVVWGPNGNQIHELPVLGNDSSSAATAINDKGQIVGISGDCDDAIGSATAKHAVLWDGGTVTELPNLGGAEFHTPTAINEDGNVAGFGDHPGDLITEAFFWSPEGGLQALGFLYAGDSLSEAFGMNARNQVVGLSCDVECRAFLWQDGAMSDLNSLIAPDDSVLLTHAMDINDDGVITGRATIRATGERVTYVATPTGSTIALGARSRGRRAQVRLSADTLREILHPLGPGLVRTSIRKSR